MLKRLCVVRRMEGRIWIKDGMFGPDAFYELLHVIGYVAWRHRIPPREASILHASYDFDVNICAELKELSLRFVEVVC